MSMKNLARRIGFSAGLLFGPGWALSQINPRLPAEILAQREYDEKQESLDRLELVTKAPKNFRPGGSGVRLRLTLEKMTLKLGSPLRYRLELVNVSSSPYYFSESPSFFKSGRQPHERINFVLSEPDGKDVFIRSPLSSGHGVEEIQFPSDATEKEKAAQFDDMRRKAQADERLVVTLAPGESLRTRGDSKNDRFRTLVTRYEFKATGKYELRAEIDGLIKVGQPSNSVRIVIRE